jgi:type III secretory pathway component EscR
MIRGEVDATTDIKRVYKYILRRGILLIIPVHRIYVALLNLDSLFAQDGGDTPVSSVEIPYKIGPITLFSMKVSRTGEQFKVSWHRLPWLKSLTDRFPGGKGILVTPLSAIKTRLHDIYGTEEAGQDFGRGERGRLFMLLLLMLVGPALVSIPYSIIVYLAFALARGVATTVKSALRPVPALLAVLVVVFATGDSWRIFGQEPYWRFFGLMAILLGVGLISMGVNLRGVKGGLRADLGLRHPVDSVFKEWAANTPAKAYRDALKPVSPIGDSTMHIFTDDALPAWPLARYMVSVNIAFLYWLTMVLNFIAIAFWISLLFVAVGIVAISETTTSGLLGNSPSLPVDVFVRFGLLGQQFVFTRQLILLSAALGAVAALNFSTGTLQDPGNRATFLDHALTDLRNALGAFAYYLAALRSLMLRLAGEMTPEIMELAGDGVPEMTAEEVLDRLKNVDARAIAAFAREFRRLFYFLG